MNRRIIVVLVCTFLLLVAATVWVPVVQDPAPLAASPPTWEPTTRLELVWRVGHQRWATSVSNLYFQAALLPAQVRVHWPQLFIEQALVLLLGGGLLTLVVRRERRRRAAAA